ncbi:MAG: hypothetical protein QXI36_01085 [Candidatus Bathyarchaeia archaeon]
MHALEYLAAGLIMIIFISFSSAVIMPSVYIPLTHIKEQQLDVLAERTTDKILLTPGVPYDWQIVETAPSEFTLYPDSIIDNNGWGSGDASSLGDGNNTTYIYTGDQNSEIKLNIAPPSLAPLTNITSVSIQICGKGDGSVTITAETGSYTESKKNINFGEDWTNITFTLGKKSWTWSELENLVVSIKSEKKNREVYCSELGVIVKCEAPPEGLIPKPLNGFGLALYEENVRSLGEPYVLDRDKVLRLTNRSVYLNPLEVARSLGLMENDHLKYGFNIKIKPALNISRSVESTTGDRYSKELYERIRVKVVNYESKPLANANVYGVAILFYINFDQRSIDVKYILSMGTTDILGEATINFDYAYSDIEEIIERKPSGNFDYTFLYITFVDFYGLKSYAIDSLSEVETPAFIVPSEDGITVLHDESDIPRGSIHMRGVFGVSLPYITSPTASGGEPKTYKIWVRTRGAESTNIINHGGKEYIFYSFRGVEQDLNAIGICFKYTGKFHFYIVSLREIIGEELNYGTSPGVGGKKTIVVAKRLVRIEGMDYVFEFRMWRMAED